MSREHYQNRLEGIHWGFGGVCRTISRPKELPESDEDGSAYGRILEATQKQVLSLEDHEQSMLVRLDLDLLVGRLEVEACS